MTSIKLKQNVTVTSLATWVAPIQKENVVKKCIKTCHFAYDIYKNDAQMNLI